MSVAKPRCIRCNEVLEISEAAFKLLMKLGKQDRPATCAKCAVDSGVNPKTFGDKTK